jgi:RND superfamily putative drug exporter
VAPPAAPGRWPASFRPRLRGSKPAYNSAVAVAGARAAAPITIAGLVLAASFALLALVPLRRFRELAFAMCVGLLRDAFLIRTVLVPALMVLIGEGNGWPGRRLRQIRSATKGAGSPAGVA